MTKIVVGVDLSTAGTAAMQWALREAVVRRAPLTVVCAWTTPTAGLESLQGRALTDLDARAPPPLNRSSTVLGGARGVVLHRPPELTPEPGWVGRYRGARGAVDAARVLAAVRLLTAVTFLAVPTLAVRGWLGEGAAAAARPGIARAMGVRDVGLCLGALWALHGEGQAGQDRGGRVVPWLRAAALAEAVDSAAVLAAGRVPARRLPVAAAGPALLAALALELSRRLTRSAR